MFGNLIHNAKKVLITSLGKEQRTIARKDKQANYSITLLMLVSLDYSQWSFPILVLKCVPYVHIIHFIIFNVNNKHIVSPTQHHYKIY